MLSQNKLDIPGGYGLQGSGGRAGHERGEVITVPSGDAPAPFYLIDGGTDMNEEPEPLDQNEEEERNSFRVFIRVCGMVTITLSLLAAVEYVVESTGTHSGTLKVVIAAQAVALSAIPYVITKSLWIIYDTGRD